MDKKTIVIVGAGVGVSSGVARVFGRRGFRVVLVSRSEEALAGHVRSLASQDIEAYGLTADATDPHSLQAVFERIRSQYGVPDTLVYNAAVIRGGTASTLTENQLLDDLKVNVVGALSSARQVIPDFVARGSGTILFTGGGLAHHPSADYASLSIGKAAMRSLVYTLGDELAPQGIYVGTVTIAGSVKEGTHFDPDRIGQVYWEMYEKREEREFIYQ
ncbi:SDR family NAD(P)-dependent oxidoreductase [Cohnella nanjingensis]|uniref:SDR family NAD(P)-dependent oxidoreductase n=1 Tax=Cohnella nanjingensis TaxID=1387779 RepID=A0A7X0VF90_9BACL|nr:SDR family NAD(P)-dependent oxidoreductase [Cohnella nanjingensis]MBB6671576.1 SDR family NAD(P)-dependent oxidoreductase [Cohnella nanjingensis]